ncbi:unnamed protein product, partial [Heterosigma akashiwo]
VLEGLVGDAPVRLYLDLKGPGVAGPALRAVRAAVRHGGWDPARLLVGTFNQYDLLRIAAYRRRHPELAAVETILILDAVPFGLARGFEDLQ